MLMVLKMPKKKQAETKFLYLSQFPEVNTYSAPISKF